MLDDLTSEKIVPSHPSYTRKEIIYGRKFGMALTMDIFSPERGANRAAIIFAVSEGWYSNHSSITPNMPAYVDPFIASGYTVFAVCHGSSPKFCLPEILSDMHRAVSFIRYHAREWSIDRNRIGMTGDSAGGYLSLMLACTGAEGKPHSEDAVDRESSSIQAAVAFYPPTDFLNWGEQGKVMLGTHPIVQLKGAFDFHALDNTTNSFELITSDEIRQEIGRFVSPITHVSKDNAPILIVHGDADTFIPLQQAQIMTAKLKAAGVPSELVIKAGGNHNEELVLEHIPHALAWFDRYLLN